ncbi:phosphoesterase RecJ domain-containing protein [Cyclonatronum proteinivorum]|uniref:Phosphoesterase RecJ domain-containing protein n=1 Tax=Cyclonatronum proteinivorum TaxID=1457365 RepID=A0A345UHN9_9BACT|nr:DHH family phosphoesterase [Cyclonatronum proteinivorum]AXI99990.1 phosphoesterase RecJ domain-containing protein [Cyclonatronum proteinivorum]
MQEYNEELFEMSRQLSQYKKIAVISHVRPDGDAIGSQIGVCLWLKAKGIAFIAHNDDKLPADIAWLDNSVGIQSYEQEAFESCDALLFVDGNTPKRFGRHMKWFENTTKPSFMIDHHPDPFDGYTYMVSVPAAASTAELIYGLYEQTDLSLLSKEAATAIYTGILTDTGGFRFSSVGAKIHHIVADLIERADLRVDEIFQRVFDNRQIKHLALIGRALSRLKLDDESGIATMVIYKKDLDETGCKYDELDGLTQFPLSLQHARVAVIFTQFEDRIKLSFRSKDDFNVNLLARNFDGGGHQKASGAWYESTDMDQAVEDVLKAAKAQLAQMAAGA